MDQNLLTDGNINYQKKLLLCYLKSNHQLFIKSFRVNSSLTIKFEVGLNTIDLKNSSFTLYFIANPYVWIEVDYLIFVFVIIKTKKKALQN